MMHLLALIHVVTALFVEIWCISAEADGLADLLLVAEAEQIEALSLGDTVEKNTVVSGLQHPAAVDYDAREHRVIFSDTGQHAIASHLLNGTGDSGRLINQEIRSPYAGIAFDWISRLVFYSDYQVIVTCRPDGRYTKPVIFTSPSDPGPIVADAQRGLIYWADKAVSGQIERVFYTGHGRQVVANNSGSVTGLALDSEQQLLYWSDKSQGQILVVDVSGNESSGQSIVLKAAGHVAMVGLSLSMTSIYWVDQNSSMVYKSARNGSMTVAFSNVTNDPYALTVYNSSRKTGWNPCSVNNCSQLCLTELSDKVCSCSYGVLDADGLTCKTPDQYLFLADNHTIRAFVINETGLHLQDAIEPITGLNKPLGVAYEPLTGNLYYTDVVERVIFEVNMTTHTRRAVLEGLNHPEQIAVDSTSRVLYFTDTKDKLIGVVSYSGDTYKKLITSDLDKPRAIVLNHINGTMYWSDWGDKPKIEMAEKTGEGRKTLIHTGLKWPNGLSLDVTAGKLYWADAHADKIEVCNLDGSGRRLVYKFDEAVHPYSIVVYNERVYFSDWTNNRGSLGSVAVSGDSEPFFFNSTYPPLGQRPCGLFLYDTPQTPVMTPCKQQGICGEADLCLQQPNGVECVCKYGFYSNATRQCDVPDQFVLFTDGNEVRGLTMESTYYDVVDVFKPIPSTSQVVALDYDAVTRSIYWTDKTNGTVMHSTINGMSEVVFSGLTNPEGLAVDWISHNIYITDVDQNVISVVSFDGRYNVVLINESLLEPREIAIDPVNGIMYWTDLGLMTIEQATMAGEERRALMDEKLLEGPTGLALDLKERKLYWADKTKDSIGEYDLSGKNTPKTYRAPSVDLFPYHMSHHAGVVYFTDQNLFGVFQWEIRSRKAYRMVRTRQPPLGVAVYDATRINGTNGCSDNKGGCSQLCLPMPMGRRCACMENDVTSCMGSIVQSPKSVVAQEFSTVIFQCQLKPETEIGVRYLTVSWLWNGMEVNNSAGRKNDMAYVIMPHVIASNVGNYTCKATNKYGSTVSEPATLTIIPRKSPDAQDQFLVVSDHDLIRGVDLVSTPASTVNLFTIPGTANISSLAFDTMSQKLLWSQVMNGTRTYVQSNFNGTVEAMTPKLNGAQCVAVDWIGRHIYFVELVPGRISLISMDASYKLVVIPKDIVEVDTLVVDPVSGLMFWLVKGASPKIEKATMSGEDRSTFLPSTFKRTWQPVALAFDQAAKRLCIADSLNNVLWYGNVDATKGQSFHVAVQDGLHLAISNGTAYMSEATTKSVWQWKLGNTTAKTKLFELSGEPSALTFYSRSGQSDQNACSRQNGGCSQICLPKPLGRVCACPETNTTSCMPSVLRGPFDKMVYKGSTVTFHCQVQNTSSLGYSVTTVVWTHNGTELLSYNTSSLPSNGDAILTLPSVDVTDVGSYYCNVSNKYGSVQSDFGFLAITPNEGYLLVAEASQIVMMDPFKFSSPVPVVRGLHRVINVDCALSNGSIIAFWVDSVQQVIAKKQLLVDVQATEVIAANVTKPYGIAVDWMGSMIFFTEQSQDFIGVVSMNGDYILPVVYLGVQDDPGPIAVDPERGWMFWANMGLGGPRIERAYMSGESRKVLVNSSSGVRRPAAIAFDPDNRQLFWIDASFDKIAKIDVQTGVQQVIDNFYHDVTPFGLALNQTSIYWTEQRESKIRVSPRKGYSFSVPPLTTSRTPFGLAFCRPKQWAGNNSCSSSNCDQLCLPNADRGRCACSYGILQKDSVTCRIPNNYILVAENRRIRGFVLNDSNTELKNAIRPINVNRPLMMDYNPLNGNLYYSDLRERAVMEVNLLGGQTRTIRAGLRYPEGVAVDPSAGVVYYCDREMNIIGAVTIEQGWNAVIIKSGLDEPRALALDIADRRIYWTDWGTTAHIGRAFMSGEERETIIQTGLGWPNAIVLDVENKKMYWSDAKFDKIEVANMNGTGRRILAQFSNKIHPFGLAIWNNSIYWTDWQKTGIARIQLSDSTSQSDLSTESLSYKYPVLDDRGGGLALVSASQKIVPSKCADNGGCIGGSVCLPDVTERRCVCHYGVYNDTNNQCEVPPTFIVISDGDQVRGIHSTSTSHAVLDVFEPLESSNPVGVDYDAVTKRIYWTDVTNNSIYSSSFQGEKEVLIGNLSQPEGVAVDWIGRKVYYTDRSLNRIGVVTMDGQQHVVILENLSRPRAIVVDPEKGYMFWSSDSKIERADMAGEWRKKLIMTPSSTSVQPIGLALDRQTQKVYWADAHQDKIVESDVHRMHGHVAFRAPGHDLYPFGLAYFNGTVYFSDQNLRGIFRWTVGSRSAKRMLITALKPAGVAFYDGGRTSGSNACSYNNGGCAQLCLPIPSGRRCACTRENTTSCQPLILTSPYSVTVEEKDTVTLSCAFMASNTTGLSYTSAQWLKNDTVVKSYNASDLRYTDFVTLEMEYVDSNHSGVYTCQATNKYGEVFSSPAKVTVKPRTSKSVQVLVAADGDRIRSIKLVSTPTVVVERFPSLLGNGTVIAVDYDITSDTVAWVESGSNSTNRFVQAFLNGTRKSAFTQYGQVKGFGYDWNTDSVFYTQPDLHRICVNTWTGSHPVVLVRNSTERPLDLVIVPELGFMWWIANSTDGQHIKKSTISGGNILRFRDDLVTSPSKLAFDRSTKKLIWIDGNKVFQCDFNGEQCSSDVMLPISRMDVKGIAATNGTLYISDQANGTIWSWRLNSTFPLTRLLDSTEIGALATYKNKLAMDVTPTTQSSAITDSETTTFRTTTTITTLTTSGLRTKASQSHTQTNRTVTSPPAMSEISKETGQATQTTQVTETTSAVGGGTQVTETTAAGEGTSRVAVTTEEKTTTVPFSGSPTSASATSANAIQATQTEATTIYHARTSQATVNVPVSSTSTSTSTSASVTSKPPKKTGQTNQTTATTQRLEATTGTIREPSQSQNLSTTATQVQSTGIRTDTLAVSSLFATTDRTKTPSTATSRRHKIPTSASVTSKRPNTSSTKYLSTSSQGSTKKHNNISTTASRPGQKEFTKDSSSRGFSLAVIISIVGVVLFLLILVVILLVIVKKRRSSSYSVSTAQTTQGSAAQFDNPAFGYHSMKEDEKLEEPDQEDKQMPADPYNITESDWTEAAVSGSTTSPKTDDKERLI